MYEGTLTRSNQLKKQWPTPQDYNEAVQAPKTSFTTAFLRASSPEHNLLGLPKATSGAFASVYKMVSHSGQAKAVRFFLTPINEQSERYEMLSRFILSDDLPYTVPFEYVHEGVLVRGQQFPIVQMEWVDGTTLDEFVRRNLDRSEVLNRLADAVERMCADLRAAGVAHGDLQHGNIIVLPDGQLRLVDYDGMFVPEMSGLESTELGHRNYQHPQRTAAHFSAQLDRFSELVIVNSLRILALDPSLFRRLHGGDECLLLRQHDFSHPTHSFSFYALETHSNKEIVRLARSIRWQLQSEPQGVLVPSEMPETLPELDPVEEPHHEASPVVVARTVSVSYPGQQERSTALNKTQELVQARKAARNAFAKRGFLLKSEELDLLFLAKVQKLLFPNSDAAAVWFAILATMLITVPTGLIFFFWPIWLIPLYVGFRIWRIRQMYKRFVRAQRQVQSHMPVKVTYQFRLASAGFFAPGMDTELYVLDDPEDLNFKIARHTPLGQDARYMDLFHLGDTLTDYVYLDPKDKTIVARVHNGKLDWLL